MSEASLSEWNRFLQGHPSPHLLQTAEWGALKSAFGWDVIRLVLGRAGAQILLRRLPLGFTIAYIPKLTVRDQPQPPGPDFWRELDEVCRRRRAIFLKIEPDAFEGEINFHPPSFLPSTENIQPRRTIVVDLHGSEDEILARMKQKCRYNIRLAEKKGVIVRPWDDLAGFYKLVQITGGRDGFGVHSAEYYQRAYQLFRPGGRCELLVAEFENRPLAALMVFARGGRAWYLYGASNDEERNRMPTYLLQWAAMRWARSKGAEQYDLWGVPDEDEALLEAQFEERHDGLWGVYRFKRGFGGALKRAAPAVDKIYRPWLYQLYLRRLAGRESG
ncbi:MAG TPA: peptidoglycan bridge formation glycyltransferase FemA/FemB family protein [Anaerolineales bacterium]|nr:peptidoglycan bridge formation glycyltransferase FemA/FemB family protein [Anaerolineales bacterium]